MGIASKHGMMLLFSAMMVSTSLAVEHNLTALFHEALSSDGSLQSSVGATGELSDLELIYLRRKPSSPLPEIVFNTRKKRNRQGETIAYNFKAFDKDYNLQLQPMSKLVSAKAELAIVSGSDKIISSPIPPTLCHYTHVDHSITAALNGCKPGTLTGYIVSDDVTLDIKPLLGVAAKNVHIAINKRGGSHYTRQGIPHIVKRIPRTRETRPSPSAMDLEIPPPSCHEPIGNAAPDEMEFDQGEIFTIPPQERKTTPTPNIEIVLFPDHVPPRPSPPNVGNQPLVEDLGPEGVFIPPISPLITRNKEFVKETLAMKRSDRQPKPMKGVDREPKPIVYPEEKPVETPATKRSDREPKPMKGVDREPKPIVYPEDKPVETPATKRSDREPKPMKGVDREPKPIVYPEDKPVETPATKRSVREPKPMKGVDREPKPIVYPEDKPVEASGSDRSDREPKPIKGVDREPKPMIFTTEKPLEPGAGENREPKPMQGVDREPKPIIPDEHNLLKRSVGGKTLELGVFIDQAAYDLFFPYLGSREALTEFILGYVNGIQALFHHPTLGQKIQLVINYIEVMSKQPTSLPHFGGDREKLYESFRVYNERKNEDATNMVDGNPWDMGILISGLNFYSVKKGGKTSYSTMGLAAVRGICHPGYSAVIVELGATDTWGKPYPSAGFASVYVMAHEMGHNLGMLHDGYGNSCPRNGYVMSASRSTSGETNWSSCSKDVVETLKAPCLSDIPTEPTKHDHSIYEQLPGQSWDAFDQCRVFLRDNDATLYNATIGESVCQTVMCRSPHRIGYFKAGPALDGTYCGNKSWCVAGTCTPWPADRSPKVVLGGWSGWEHSECSSGCIVGGMGVQVSHRACTNPKPSNTAERCQGHGKILNVCDDSQVCKGNRLSTTSYADQKCHEFSKVVEDLMPIGAQAPHNPDRKWQACAIFCQRASGTWYSPRTDLSHLPNFDTYFPDGTACHSEGKISYYCQSHQCLPKGERQARELQEPDPEWDVHVYQNAPPRPSNLTVPEQVARIFELSENMDPVQVEPLDLIHEDDEDLWEDNDYYHPIPARKRSGGFQEHDPESVNQWHQ